MITGLIVITGYIVIPRRGLFDRYTVLPSVPHTLVIPLYNNNSLNRSMSPKLPKVTEMTAFNSQKAPLSYTVDSSLSVHLNKLLLRFE